MNDKLHKNKKIREMNVLYILESNPHPFLQFQRAKKSDADYNRVRIRFAFVSWILGKMIEPLYVP